MLPNRLGRILMTRKEIRGEILVMMTHLLKTNMGHKGIPMITSKKRTPPLSIEEPTNKALPTVQPPMVASIRMRLTTALFGNL